MQPLDEERKQELIMAKQIRRDTVVIHGGGATTITTNNSRVRCFIFMYVCYCHYYFWALLLRFSYQLSFSHSLTPSLSLSFSLNLSYFLIIYLSLSIYPRRESNYCISINILSVPSQVQCSKLGLFNNSSFPGTQISKFQNAQVSTIFGL